MVIHHLTTENKKRTMHEIYRVLCPGGELGMVDFGEPRQAYGRLTGLVMRWMEQANDNIKGRLPGMIYAAGFKQVREPAQYITLAGDLSVFWARK
jgi:ubiquinone/menaquinone biosynthesis C-methylase UbiE